MEAIAPPGVCAGQLRVAVAEGVGKSGGEQLGELAAFLIGKASIPAVRSGIFEVDRLMRDVQITAGDHRLLRVQCAQIRAEGVVPRHTVVYALEPVLRVRRVAGHKEEAFKFQRDQPTLGVEFRHAEPISDRQRLKPRKNGSSGIALLFSAVPILAVAGEIEFDLPGLELRLLKAEAVGADGVEEVLKALSRAGAQPVYIP